MSSLITCAIAEAATRTGPDPLLDHHRVQTVAGREIEEETVRQLLEAFEELPVDRPIAERAGRLRRAGGLRTPDALIAATALEHQCTLVTRNTRDSRKHGV